MTLLVNYWKYLLKDFEKYIYFPELLLSWQIWFTARITGVLQESCFFVFK